MQAAAVVVRILLQQQVRVDRVEVLQVVLLDQEE
jgi:hypothetical protein